MESLGTRGATDLVKVHTPDIGTVGAEGPTDMGDVVVVGSVTISGVVELPEGVEKVPEELMVELSGNSLLGGSAKVNAEGAFKFVGVRPGAVSLRVYGNSLRISKENKSYSMLSHTLVERVKQDTTLRIRLMSTGEGPETFNNTLAGSREYDALELRPLVGVK